VYTLQILKYNNKLVLQMMEAQKDEKLKLKRRQLNHLLGFTCVRLKERVGTNRATIEYGFMFMAHSVSLNMKYYNDSVFENYNKGSSEK